MVIRLAFLTAGLLGAAEIGQLPAQLTVHEWGTFTSIADQHGVPQVWKPLTKAASDLPSFVHRFEGIYVKRSLAGTVRMETPVLYFYSPRPATASVHVDFRQGAFTEWYPRAKVEPSFYNPAVVEWNPIQISPAEHALPQEPGHSHYYAARNTDALNIESGGEHDKLLFYRGVGNFDIPFRAAFGANGELELSNQGLSALPFLVIFENRAGKRGYYSIHNFVGPNIVGLAQLSGSLPELRSDLAAELVASGLYPREAAAMLDTWGDSWFEEGLRVFYILPQSSVDAVLPLSITPQPEKIARVFVGRVEILAPWMRDAIVTALGDGSLEILEKYGRFLQPFMQQIGNTPHAESTDAWLRTIR